MNDTEYIKKFFLAGARALIEGLSAQKKNEENEEAKKQTDIIKEFEEIDKNSDLGDMFKRAEYNPPTDEEIRAAAEKETADKLAGKKEKIIESVVKAYSALEEQKQTAAQKAEEKKRAAAADYDEKTVKAKNDALKKGLARSSVIEERLKQLQGEKSAEQSEIEKKLKESLADIESRISEAAAKKEQASEEFDLDYAAELDKKIAALEAQRNKKAEEIEAYNNQMAEKEKKYYEKDEGAEKLLKIQEQKLAAAKKYYDNMTKEEALKDFTGNEYMKKHLGAYYHYMLNYLNTRK